MDARTLEALQASIAKWERNAAIENIEDAKLNVSSCALCNVFYADRCHGCPVFELGHYQCDGTPYDDAHAAYGNYNIGAFRTAAKREVAFLQSLLPAALKATGG